MSNGRLTLRPVVWSEVDSFGHTRRRSPSPDEDVSESSDTPPRKKKKKPIGPPVVTYPPSLTPSERLWRDRYAYFGQLGYQLRPRYRPDWSPNWTGSGRHFQHGEDHIMQIVLDATRAKDGMVVCIKMIQDPRKVQQIRILQWFSTRTETRNHVVTYLDTFPDNYMHNSHYLVTPVLRRFDDPEFGAVSEIVDFITQILEGMAFLHENNIAHHNLTAEHIMMEAKPILPTGWHFVSPFCEPDGINRVKPLARRDHPVRYVFIGFGTCYHIPLNQRNLVHGIGGNDDEVPELRHHRPYDPFKLDIYTLGNKFEGLDFLYDLIGYMRVPEFERRPSAEVILRKWLRVRDQIDLRAMEDTPLQFRDRARQRSPYNSDSATSANSRSHKRDISSILNK
ncbi:hypothetical protein D9619_000741 [Psilocybe cf. subviscida]|uniref:Protein kinase domain-containing protein n=1 Tax=Psilocybe cf. subviscida TaxID=2480587 RepID=A0A8H5F227_9AGAR|nr:hypothetical protein D9619_000741 [Psilocybe cf. subviscida]